MLLALWQPASAEDRAAHLEGKDGGPRPTIVLDGRYVHNIGNLQINVTNWGFLGSLPSSRYPMSDSPSAQWPAGSGVEYLYAAGIWVGALVDGIPAVSTGWPDTEFYPTSDPVDRIYATYEGDHGGKRRPAPADDDRDGYIDEDWLNGRDDDGDGKIDEDFAAVSQQMFSCWFTDDQPASQTVWPEHTPLNIHIRQETYQWGEAGLNDFVGVHYRITNIGRKFMSGVYFGIYADVDAGPRFYGTYHRDDRVGYWSGIRCAPWGEAQYPVRIEAAYVYDGDGDDGKTPGYFGVVPLGCSAGLPIQTGYPRIHAFRVFRGLQPFEGGGEPTNDYERYEVLSDQMIGHDTGDPNDYKFLVSIRPFGSLSPGRTLDLHLAFVCGEGLEEMLDNAAKAWMVFRGRWYDGDGDPSTGIIGRETPMYGPLDDFDPDAFDGKDEKIDVGKGEVIWANMDSYYEWWAWRYRDCWGGILGHNAYRTGLNGMETQLFWVTGSAPPPPNMRVLAGDNSVTLLWDNLSETVPDNLSMKIDFEGYQIWRADNWHRPPGTSELTGPEDHLWHLLELRDRVNYYPPNVDFEKPFEEGGWQYKPLRDLHDRERIIQMFEEVLTYYPADTVPCPPGLTDDVCDTLEAIARFNLGYEGGKRYYKFIDREAKNGMPYFYSVIAYDHEAGGWSPEGFGRANSPAANFAYISPTSAAQQPESFKEDEIYVVPNPVTDDNMAPWRFDPNNSDPTGLKLEFRNLPRCKSTVRIYTIAGDLVETLYHDGSNGNGTLPWDLLTRNGQDVTSGVYLYSVDPADGRFSRKIGKFVIIR
jgi:hypothetical protein